MSRCIILYILLHTTQEDQMLAEDTTMQSIEYWSNQQEQLGFETVWSIWEFSDIDQNIFKSGPKRVTFQFVRYGATVEEIYEDLQDGGNRCTVEVSSFAASGSVRDLWRAAESCYQQAKQQGDHHPYIEGFELQDDGSYQLSMGS